MMRFYFDHHVPRAIVHGVRLHDVDVLTAFEDGHASGSDADLLARADALGRLLFTMDADFLELADELIARGAAIGGIVYAHQLRVTVGQCVADLRLIAECGESVEFADRVTHLPL